jgi:alpha-tubulin suppressor-like RCC1 family protein
MQPSPPFRTGGEITRDPNRCTCLLATCLAILILAAAAPLSAATNRVIAWSPSSSALTNIPPGVSNVIALAAGDYHALALLESGRVASWAQPGFQVVEQPPPGLSNVISIAAGTWHSLALGKDGSVRAWGWTDHGQCNVPLGLQDVISVAGGTYHSVAAKQDGTVVAWGFDDWGELSIPPLLSNAVAVAMAAGYYHSLAVRANGTVFVWGADSVNGRIEGLSNIVSVAAQGQHDLALKADGSAVALEDGQPVGSPFEAETNLVAIAVGGWRYCLRADGTVASWPQDAAASGLSNVVALAAGGAFSGFNHAVALIGTGEPVVVRQAIGRMAYRGESVVLNAGIVAAPPARYQWWHDGVEIPGATRISHVLADVQDGDVGTYTVVVSNRVGVVTATNTFLEVQDQPPTILRAPEALTTYRGANISLEVVAEGSNPMSYQWIRNGHELPGAANALLALHGVQFTDTGLYFVTVQNAFGRRSTVPVLVSVGTVAALGIQVTNVPPGLTNITAIAARSWHNLALRDDGTVVAWRSNDFEESTMPDGLTNVVQIGAGDYFSLALTADGRVVAWGAKDNPRFAPVDCGQTRVPDGVSNVVEIAAGAFHSMARTREGRIVAWGAGLTSDNAVPSGLSNVVAIAAGSGVSYALKTRLWSRFDALQSVYAALEYQNR